MVLEALIPGLVVIFLGMAACLVAGLIYWGYIDGWMEILTTWFISSLALIVLLRGLFQKFAPGEEEVGDVDEDADAIGTIVEVVERITSDAKTGRVRFRGTSWEAVSKTVAIEKGQHAKLVERRDLVWYVVPSPKN
jgi:membrane protein implicated in regulation of membrane protease activity